MIYELFTNCDKILYVYKKNKFTSRLSSIAGFKSYKREKYVAKINNRCDIFFREIVTFA